VDDDNESPDVTGYMKLSVAIASQAEELKARKATGDEKTVKEEIEKEVRREETESCVFIGAKAEGKH
jgi:hypothetical protein